MTRVTKKLLRQCAASLFSGGASRAVIVELPPPGAVIGFRLKGTRRTYYLPVDWCFREAVRAASAR